MAEEKVLSSDNNEVNALKNLFSGIARSLEGMGSFKHDILTYCESIDLTVFVESKNEEVKYMATAAEKQISALKGLAKDSLSSLNSMEVAAEATAEMLKKF